MTPLRFLATNKIMIGVDYAIPVGLGYAVMAARAVGLKKRSFGDYCIEFSDKVLHPIVHNWNRVAYQPLPEASPVVVIDSRKEPDADYYKAKQRHIELCNKKLHLNNTGRAHTMKNAYINQELEMLRSILSKYKTPQTA